MIDYSLSYKVVKAVSGRFDVDTPSGIVTCVARKKIKNKSDILLIMTVHCERKVYKNKKMLPCNRSVTKNSLDISYKIV